MGRLRWAGVCSGARSAPLRVYAPRKTLRSSCSLEDEGTSAANASIRCGFHECKHSARGRGVAHNPRLPLSREGDHEVVVGEFQRQSYFPTDTDAHSAPLRVCAPRKILHFACASFEDDTLRRRAVQHNLRGFGRFYTNKMSIARNLIKRFLPTFSSKK